MTAVCRFRTALLCATMEGHGEAVEALLDAGADAAVQVTHFLLGPLVSLPSIKKLMRFRDTK